MAEFRNPVVLHYIDIWHLLNSNLILIFVTFLNVVEDEYHFVLECNIYTDLRTQYIPNYYRCRPNIYNFVDLLNIENYQKTGCLYI